MHYMFAVYTVFAFGNKFDLIWFDLNDRHNVRWSAGRCAIAIGSPVAAGISCHQQIQQHATAVLL